MPENLPCKDHFRQSDTTRVKEIASGPSYWLTIGWHAGQTMVYDASRAVKEEVACDGVGCNSARYSR